MRGTGSLWTRKDGVHAGAISLGSIGGKRVRLTFYGPDEQTVQDKLRRALALATAGHAQPSKLSLGDFLAAWLEREASRVAPSTLADYRRIVTDMPPWLLATTLGKLSGAHVQAWIDGMTGAPRTIAWRRNTLRAALNHARRLELVERNVAALVLPPRQHRPRRIVLTATDCRAILAAGNTWRYYPALAVALGTGLRQGELLGLAWADVALNQKPSANGSGGLGEPGRLPPPHKVGESRVSQAPATASPGSPDKMPKNRITVRQSLHRLSGEYVLGDTKTDASQATVPLPAFAAAALAEWAKTQAAERAAAGVPESIDGGLVFTTARGTPVNGSVLTHQFQKRLVAAGLPVVPWHALRHATADVLADAGVPATVARDLLRHASVTTTQDHYVGTGWDALAQAAGALDRAIGGKP